MQVWYGSTIHLADDAGYLMHSVDCPVQCGRCCIGWRAVPELSAYYHVQGDCPHLRGKGCKLAKRDRPLSCQGYICELALLVIGKQLNVIQIQKTIAAKKQLEAFAFLGLHSVLSAIDPQSIRLKEEFRTMLALTKQRILDAAQNTRRSADGAD